jgi:hypothetical protein
MSEIYTNDQVAEVLSVSASTIRSWKTRKSDQLVENTHWFIQDNQTLWTVKGLEVLRLLQNTVAVKVHVETDATDTTATDTTATDATESVAEGKEGVADPLQRYTGLVEAVANAITPGLLQRIDNAVTGRVKSAIATPMSPAECVTLLTELGLKPCNPELLLTGNQPNLLTESKEN